MSLMVSRFDELEKHFKRNLIVGQSPSSQPNTRSATQEIRLLWNPKVDCRVHNSPPLIPTLSQMYPIQNFAPYFPKVHSNIIFSSTPRRAVIVQSV
jgi:hypothetical protein